MNADGLNLKVLVVFYFIIANKLVSCTSRMQQMLMIKGTRSITCSIFIDKGGEPQVLFVCVFEIILFIFGLLIAKKLLVAMKKTI